VRIAIRKMSPDHDVRNKRQIAAKLDSRRRASLAFKVFFATSAREPRDDRDYFFVNRAALEVCFDGIADLCPGIRTRVRQTS
jgi:hypothetical protein